jgi:hypothetical protein
MVVRRLLSWIGGVGGRGARQITVTPQTVTPQTVTPPQIPPHYYYFTGGLHPRYPSFSGGLRPPNTLLYLPTPVSTTSPTRCIRRRICVFVAHHAWCIRCRIRHCSHCLRIKHRIRHLSHVWCIKCRIRCLSCALLKDQASSS